MTNLELVSIIRTVILINSSTEINIFKITKLLKLPFLGGKLLESNHYGYSSKFKQQIGAI